MKDREETFLTAVVEDVFMLTSYGQTSGLRKREHGPSVCHSTEPRYWSNVTGHRLELHYRKLIVLWHIYPYHADESKMSC